MRALTQQEMDQVSGGCFFRQSFFKTRSSYGCHRTSTKTGCYSEPKTSCDPKPACDPAPVCDPTPVCESKPTCTPPAEEIVL